MTVAGKTCLHCTWKGDQWDKYFALQIFATFYKETKQDFDKGENVHHPDAFCNKYWKFSKILMLISPLLIFLHSVQKKMTPPYKIHKIDPSALTTWLIHKL